MRFRNAHRGSPLHFLLQQNALNVRKTGRLLQELMDRCDDMDIRVEEIASLERFGDEVSLQSSAALQSAKFSPLERRDFAALTDALDGIVDGIGSAANAMLAYGIDASTERARVMAEAIAKGCADLEKGIGLLPEHKDRGPEILRFTASIKAATAGIERSSGGELAPHFTDGQDAATILKWRDIYGHLKQAVTQTRAAADVLELALLPKR